ncbi:short-chain fatty acid transporter, partial [Francisella tularensis subsp. holarctica]|nr:short-chain fatty acid transporter [Francisella tularensis subsp. holarctica]
MSLIADLTGLSRQNAVLALQIGDGWTHCIMTTSATLIAALGVERIPYCLWLKFIFKLNIYLMNLSSIMVVICL